MEALLTPLDTLRSAALRLFGAYGQRFLARREERVLLYAVVGLAVAFALTCASPVLLFALGPILLGTVHLVSDVRYLVARPGLHRRGWLFGAMLLPLAATWIWPRPSVGLVAAFAPVLFARTSHLRRALASMAFAALYVLATQSTYVTTLVLVHAHNLVAIALFAVLFARRRGASLVLAALFLALAIGIVSGAFDGLLLRPLALSPPKSALSLQGMVRSLTPPGTGPLLGARIVALFVFAQSVHYAVWLRLVPEEARERAGVRSFRSSFRALKRDLGAPVLLLSLAVGVIVAGYALFALEASRILYLRVAAFHTYLELAALMLVVLEGRAAFQLRSARARDA